MSYGGPGAVTRAKLARDVVLKRLELMGVKMQDVRAELIGMEVFCGDTQIGKIREVLDYPGNAVYVVRGTEEYMIPAVKQFVLSTDLEKNVMQVRLIEGMRSDEN